MKACSTVARQPAPPAPRSERRRQPRRLGRRRSTASPATRWSRREGRAAGDGARERRRRRGERRTPRPAAAVSPSPRRGAGRPPGRRLGAPRNRPSERAGAASGIAGAAERRADIHQRLGEIAGPAARRQRSRRRCELASRARDRLFEGEESRQNARDIAVDWRGLAAEGDRRDRGRGIGADARQGAQLGLLAGKRTASPSDFLGAGVQIARSRIIAETRECAHDVFGRGRGQILDPRPSGDEGLIIRRRRLRSCLLQQHFGEPDAVGVGRSPPVRRATRATGGSGPTRLASGRQSPFALPRTPARLHWRSCHRPLAPHPDLPHRDNDEARAWRRQAVG